MRPTMEAEIASELHVVRIQRPRSIGVRQSRVGIQPRPGRVRLTTGLELTGPIDHEGIVARLSL